MPIKQGRNGSVVLNGTTLPAYSWRIIRPRKLQAPIPVGNPWQTHIAEGLQSSMAIVTFDVRELATEFLAAAFWNLWLTRTFSSGFDDSTAFTSVFSDASQSWTLANTKAESFALSVRPGGQVGLQGVFLAPGLPTAGDVTPNSYSPFNSSPPLMFNRATVGGVTGSTYGWDLSYSNNHLPNAALNGTKTMTSWDAGIRSCGFSAIFDARQAASPPYADGATLTVALTNGSVTNTFSMTSVTPENPNDRDVDPGQVFQTWAGIVMGSNTTAPLTLVVS